MRRLVIFDFDGVLADSFDALYTTVRDAFATIGMSLTPEQYRAFFVKNIKQAQKELLTDDAKFDQLQKVIRAKKPERYETVRLFPFVPEMLQSLARDVHLAIVSSTLSSVIHDRLSPHDLSSLFMAICDTERETSKKEKLAQVCTLVTPPPEKIFFVSDTVGDLHEGKAMGFTTVGVTWGFHDDTTLRTAHPDIIVESGDLLLKYLSS